MTKTFAFNFVGATIWKWMLIMHYLDMQADEYDNCFLGLSPDIAVVTNVELDHVDIFQDEV